jgi:caa(3)-type oxidase subunit IV
MSAHAEAHAEHHEHPNYVRIWAILVGLLVVSVTGPMLGIRVVTLIAAFGIALVKAYLVAKNFMHVNVEKPFIHWILGLALILMVLLYAGVSPDAGRDKGLHWTKDAGWHHLAQPAGGHEAHEGKGGASH